MASAVPGSRRTRRHHQLGRSHHLLGTDLSLQGGAHPSAGSRSAGAQHLRQRASDRVQRGRSRRPGGGAATRRTGNLRLHRALHTAQRQRYGRRVLSDTPLRARVAAQRILEYAGKHLNDPDLCAERIPVAHYISERHLYRVLAEGDISLAHASRRWVRIQSAAKPWQKPPTTTTIAAIARRHGFTDMSSFSRAFRAEYGLSPGEWRDLCARRRYPLHG